MNVQSPHKWWSTPLISGGPLHSLAVRLLVLRLCLQVERGQASLVRLGPLWWH